MAIVIDRGASAASGAATGLANFDGLQPVASHAAAPGGNSTVSDGTQTSTTYSSAHTVIDDTTSLSFVHSNWYIDATNGETVGPNAVTITASVLMPDGTLVQCTWRGATSVTVAPGADVRTDPIYCELTAGQVIYTRTCPSVATSGQVWPLGSTTKSPGSVYNAGSGLVVGSDATMTATPTWTLVGNQSYGPSMILGKTKVARRPIVAIWGSSTAWGWNDDDDMYGYSERACMTQKACFVKVAKPAEQGASALATLNARRRGLKMMAGCTHAILAFGPNDIGTGSATFTGVATTLLSLAGKLAALGVGRVYFSVLFPRTTSDDSFATVQNQSLTTVTGMQSVLAAVNVWARGGFPVNTSGVPVTPGTSGAVNSPLFAGVVEVSDVVSTGHNSGVWQPAYASDGTHPNGPGSAAAAAAVPTFKLDAADIIPTVTPATLVKTPAGKPTGLALTASSGQLAVAWTAPVNNWGDPITDYTVQYRTSAGPGSWQTFSHTASTATSATITGLTNSTAYDVQVAAVNPQGTGSFCGYATGAPSSGFSYTGPNSLTGIQAWYDPQSFVAASVADGTAVSSWSDKSSNAYAASQSTAGAKPTFRTAGINSTAAVQFAGSQWLASNLPGGGPSFTVICTVLTTSGGSGNRDILGGNATNGRVIRMQGSTYDQLAFVNEGTALMSTQTDSSTPQATPHVYAITYDSTGGVNNWTMRVNGTSKPMTAGANSAALATSGVTSLIGGEGTGSNTFVGYLGNIVSCSGVLDIGSIRNEEQRQATAAGLSFTSS